MTSEFDHEKCRQHVCTECYRYFWTVEKYDVKAACPYCGENPVHPDLREGGEQDGTNIECEDCEHVRETTEENPTLVNCNQCGSYNVRYADTGVSQTEGSQ